MKHGDPRLPFSPGHWRKPHSWNDFHLECSRCGLRRRATSAERHSSKLVCNCGGTIWISVRPRVFPSLCDWLDKEAPIEWLANFLRLIRDTPYIDWLLLTKRPELWRERCSAAADNLMSRRIEDKWLFDWIVRKKAPSNIWFGVSIENQKWAELRIKDLIPIPARVRFLSCEPLLGPIDLEEARKSWTGADGIDWAIWGGESGPGASPCNIEWLRAGVKQCRELDIPCFIKQLGDHVPCAHCGTRKATCIGKYEAMTTYEPACDECCGHGNEDGHCEPLKTPKGGNPAEWPGDLRIREFPSL
jgi:protein gp37